MVALNVLPVFMLYMDALSNDTPGNGKSRQYGQVSQESRSIRTRQQEKSTSKCASIRKIKPVRNHGEVDKHTRPTHVTANEETQITHEAQP